MQKLMVMRLCNPSEYRHSMNYYSQECLCSSQTGAMEATLNTLGPDAHRAP